MLLLNYIFLFFTEDTFLCACVCIYWWYMTYTLMCIWHKDLSYMVSDIFVQLFIVISFQRFRAGPQGNILDALVQNAHQEMLPRFIFFTQHFTYESTCRNSKSNAFHQKKKKKQICPFDFLIKFSIHFTVICRYCTWFLTVPWLGMAHQQCLSK